ncbi:MAG: NAD(P)H-dependent oxidoreductase [Bacteroidia bacterium]|nr:NAD(P)H-dependent oxidoreductase [Bacteroidia bacterium]
MGHTIALLLGSVRRERAGIRAAEFMRHTLEERGHRVHFIDPVVYPLPLLDKMYKEFKPGEAPAVMQNIAGMLTAADGIMLVTAEYNHSIPPALKNTMDHFQREYYFKPAGICSYSAGRFGGSHAAIHLRVVCGELGMVSISSILTIAQITKAIDAEGKPLDEKLPARADRFLREFEWYVDALTKARANGEPF